MSEHCPGVAMKLGLINLFPGSKYTIQLIQGAVFTGSFSSAALPPGSLTITGTEVTLIAPQSLTQGDMFELSLGVAIKADAIVGFTTLTDVSHMTVSLLGLEAGSNGGRFEIYGWPSLPPTCVMTNTEPFNCPVCAGDGSKCLQSPGAGSQFYLDMHQIVNCIECPDECTPLTQG